MRMLSAIWPAIAAVAMLAGLMGCQGTTATGSHTYEKPAAAASELRVLYVHSELTSKRIFGNPSVRFADLATLGYPALPGLIESRAPKVLEINGISAVAKSTRSDDLDPAGAMKALAADGSLGRVKLLTLQVQGENAFSNGASTSRTLKMQATLFDESWKKRLWSADYDLLVRRTPFERTGIDQAYVDAMLGKVLATMHQDGLVRLAGGSVKLPEGPPS